ncbi:MAG: DmsC/YnfH family molybdoenzyme membrane anchor subunit [Hyphomicrobiaceae bacterium]
MHPAYSVILFTTSSGAGFGLLAWLAFGILTSPPASSFTFYLVAFALAYTLAIGGLLCSTFHLGHPERAWRALSQWRTSWLSREGVAAIAALGIGALLALAALADVPVWLQRILAAPTLVLALATVWCTGMIYETLPTIRAWSHVLTTEVYLMLALASGALVLTTILALLGWPSPGAAWAAIVLLALSALMKAIYWNGIDAAPRTFTVGSAVGLGAGTKVRPLLEAHTEANFVMREMGYRVARKHADKLRLMVMAFAFAVPILLLVLLIAKPVLGPFAATLATISAGIGLFTERWLFFAEAQHVVTLYYGAARA